MKQKFAYRTPVRGDLVAKPKLRLTLDTNFIRRKQSDLDKKVEEVPN